MASSNKHWPSMFKSKPCNSHHNQWKNDINSHSLMSSGGCYRIPNTSVDGCEERTQEPKQRWNPKPEQIRILEAIFNSGMVNPPRDEIRKIRAQLQEYGQVGDANVFYWFQNRKSRSKNKRIHLQNSSKQHAAGHHNVITTETLPPSNTNIVDAAAAPSSSSSSDKSSPRGPKRPFSLTSPTANSLLNMQSYFQAHTNTDLVVPAAAEPFLFPTPQAAGLGGEGGAAAAVGALGIGFSEVSNVIQGQEQKHTVVGPWTANINSAILNYGAAKKQHQDQEKATPTMKIQPQPEPAEYSIVSSPDPIAYTIGLARPLPPSTIISTNNVTVPSTINQVQGAGQIWAPTISGGAAVRSTVFINDVAFEVGVGPLNVREAFGDDVVLIHSSGQPVLTDEWGVTLRPLQHGASYYLLPLNFHI